MNMWNRHLHIILGLFISLFIHISHSLNYECDHELWDEVTQGRGVKKLEFSCTSGRVVWHSPYGGLFVSIDGPLKEHRLCIQAKSSHTSAIISAMEEFSEPKRLITIEEASKIKQPKHTTCFAAHGNTLLFIEPDIGAFVSAKIVIDYDVETNPKYGEDACSPCSDEELLYHYCTSDFVAIGHMKAVMPSPAVNTIPVSLNLVKQQSSQYFTKSPTDNTYTGKVYTPGHCKMEHGRGKFVFMGKIKFDRAELKCAPTYEDFADLQRTSKLKGTALCS